MQLSQVYIVVGVWRGTPQEVSAYTEEKDANAEKERLSREWGIEPGLESFTPHAVAVFPTILKVA